MRERLYRDDPLSPAERDEYERDLIAFSDRELDLLGDIRARKVLYAGGTSALWIEGLTERIGPAGSLTVLDADAEGLENARSSLHADDLPLRPDYIPGDVFDPPIAEDNFDLIYSSGLLHELDVSGRTNGLRDVLDSLLPALHPSGVFRASDFADDAPSSQVEEEAIAAEVRRLATGVRPLGIMGRERIEELLEDGFACAGSRETETEIELHPPLEIRHLDKLFLAQPEPDGMDRLEADDAETLRRRWQRLKERVRREGYTRPATVGITVRARL